MMIRRGKAEGWLKLPNTALPAWATLNGVDFNSVAIELIPGREERGSAIVSKTQRLDTAYNPLLVVPGDLVLSLKTVERQARYDTHLQDLLNALGDFSTTARGAILLFLLLQASRSCPDIGYPIGTPNQFTDYIKFLPLELLPTFWTDEERELLIGTSLAPATEAKLKALRREYDSVRSLTEVIPWCEKIWWNFDGGLLSFDDWMQVDAMYRSRALEFPGIGDSMVPVIDMANHASGGLTGALYEADDMGNGLLLLRDGKQMEEGEEVTITYGDGKGACEMLFSYGFIEDGMQDARDIFLDLEIPDDDPLKHAKKAASNTAPGVRLSSNDDGIHWNSEFVWIICVNEEDGLDLRTAETADGSRNLEITWKEEIIDEVSQLEKRCQEDDLWDVFHLRAVSVIQDRVAQQLQVFYSHSPELSSTMGDDLVVRDGPRRLAIKLRELEIELLERAYECLESQKMNLVETATVTQYLASMADKVNDTDDFS